MKVLISSYHNPNFVTITEYVGRAAASMGHEVIAFDDRSFLLPGRIREAFPVAQNWDLKRMNEEFQKQAKKLQPDVCIVLGGHRISSESIKLLKAQGAWTALWTIDAPVDFGPVTQHAPFYDHVFCGGSEAVEILEKYSITNLTWLPFACDADMFQSTVPKQESKYDVVFVGSHYPNREELFTNLTDFNFAIYGPGWDRLPRNSRLNKHVKGGNCTPEEWIKVFGSSKIVLVSHYQEQGILCYQASPKLYEALGCGSFVLCDDQKDARQLFEDKKHLVYFKDGDDLKKKVRMYLNDDSDQDVIAQAGKEEVLAKHTYRHRLQTLLSYKRTTPRKARVVHMIEDLNVGGMELMVASIIRHMDKSKYDIELWSIAHGGDVIDELIGEGYNVKTLHIKSYYNPLNIFKCARMLKEANFDIIHCHGYYAATIGRIAAILARIPIRIVHVHTVFYAKMKPRNVRIDQFLNRFTQRIIFISHAVRDSFKQVGYLLNGNSTVIYNGISDFDKNNSSPLTNRTLINVASLTPQKGQSYLIQAMGKVVKKYPDARLNIIGEGPLRSDLEEEIKQAKLEEHISLLGRRHNVGKHLKESGVFVLSSTREGIPLSVIEAMACRLPVVASDVGGLCEMVEDHTTGYLCPPSDVDALAESICALLETPLACEQMGAQGRRVFEEKFLLSTMLDNIDDVYQSCLTNIKQK